MAMFHYVYILISESNPDRHYTGLTENLRARVEARNSGQLPYTAKYKPWRGNRIPFSKEGFSFREVPQMPLRPSICEEALLKSPQLGVQ